LIPYFQQPSLHLFGPVTIHAFGFLVAMAVIVGSKLALMRCERRKMDSDVCAELIFCALVAGFLVAHVSSVLAYFPRQALKDPLLLLKFWEDISSFGGMVGGVLGIWLFFRFRAPGLDARTRWKYLDILAFVFPFAWTIGRLACTTAHDHPGTITTFPLAVSLKTPEARAYITAAYRDAGRLAELPGPLDLARMAFHDLGWYEFLYTLLVIVPVFLLLDRGPRQPGFYVIVFLLLYVPARFGLDFLRLNDTRYFGLTPGQYAGLAVFVAALYAFRRNADVPRPRSG
jgi:phosphatidylglycerol:prolipoprotein diacylglycerol transferase